MGDWVPFNSGRPIASSFVVYYLPGGKYVAGSASDYDEVKKEYPTVSHWKIVTEAP